MNASAQVGEVSMPTEAEWQAAAEMGNQAISMLLLRLFEDVMARGGGSVITISVALGGLTAVGELMRSSCLPEGHTQLEIAAIACLRGSIRGTAYPINEDGSEFTRAFHG